MNLGKILGSISPAFGLATGKGMFGQMQPMMGMGMGGILGMLLGKHGMGGQGGEEEAAPAADMSAMYPGVDPMFTQGGGQQGFGGGGGNALHRFLGSVL